MKRVPLFVASTFRDMDDERDLLAHLVVPEVNERLQNADFDIEIYLVDFRWGINTREHSRPELRQRIIIDTCVEEVRRCDLFLGLLGDKYGWIAPDEVRGPVIASAGLVEQPGFPLSVTAIEFLTAAGLKDRAAEPIFLRRRTTATDRALAAAQLGVIFDDRLDLVDALHRRLEFGDTSVHSYPASWSPERRQLELEAFIGVATGEIWRQAQRIGTKLAESTWLDRELTTQRVYAAALASPLLGREQELWALNEFLETWLPAEGGKFPAL